MRMLGLRSRIFFLLGILVTVNLTGALATLWYVQHTQTLFALTMEQGAEGLATAQEMHNSLLSQRGFVSYYFLDGNTDWIKQLEKDKQDFETWWRKSLELTQDRNARDLLFAIDSEYIRYAMQRERVIEYYQKGERENGAALHVDVRKKFKVVSSLCDDFTNLEKTTISNLILDYNDRFDFFTWMAWSAIVIGAVLGLLLSILIFRRVLTPIHKITDVLAAHVDKTGQRTGVMDEVEYLSDKIQVLLRGVDRTQHKLAKSREELMQSEKLATIGKLAAGVAHSVRNPLTSVKMRLFTLERGMHLSVEAREDLEVINEEIDFIDAILRNFLEFSRPPKLRPLPVSPSDIVDQSLQLLRHKLESMDVAVEVKRDNRMPLVQGDPDQLKEVLVNLLVNAMEAMGEHGSIIISEEEGVTEPYGHVVLIRVADSGPGLPASVQPQIFEPFISTKEDGTGLGLAIARRIMEEHGGWLHVTSAPGQGATFVVGLPRVEYPS